MVNITIYVEGGGDSGRLKTECRQGFIEFFKKLGIVSSPQNKINFEACGGRSTAFNDFRKKLKNLKKNEYCLLLVDSEAPITHSSVWQHVLLREGDKWQKPDNASEEHLHFMTECMEAWFMADKQTLVDYYGKDFEKDKLPQRTYYEEIPKVDLIRCLKNATWKTTKGEYSKGGHSFKILSKIDATKLITIKNKGDEKDKIKLNTTYAQRLYDTLYNVLNPSSS